jgi:hypothetical protein
MIAAKEFISQRVVTFKDIDLVHERPEGTAGRNFRENKGRFIEGEDYFQRNSSEAKNEYGVIAPNGLTLITEQGYLMLVKSFTDDLAWKVQRDLVNTYFKVKKPKTAMELLEIEFEAIKEVTAKVEAVDQDLQSFKKDMPLLGIEESRITAAVKRKGVHCLGGKNTEAYHDKSVRGKVYSDIYSQLKREFGVETYKAIKRNQADIAISIIEGYELPMALEEEINDMNAQMVLR